MRSSPLPVPSIATLRNILLSNYFSGPSVHSSVEKGWPNSLLMPTVMENYHTALIESFLLRTGGIPWGTSLSQRSPAVVKNSGDQAFYTSQEYPAPPLGATVRAVVRDGTLGSYGLLETRSAAWYIDVLIRLGDIGTATILANWLKSTIFTASFYGSYQVSLSYSVYRPRSGYWVPIRDIIPLRDLALNGWALYRMYRATQNRTYLDSGRSMLNAVALAINDVQYRISINTLPSEASGLIYRDYYLLETGSSGGGGGGSGPPYFPPYFGPNYPTDDYPVIPPYDPPYDDDGGDNGYNGNDSNEVPIYGLTRNVFSIDSLLGFSLLMEEAKDVEGENTPLYDPAGRSYTIGSLLRLVGQAIDRYSTMNWIMRNFIPSAPYLPFQFVYQQAEANYRDYLVGVNYDPSGKSGTFYGLTWWSVGTGLLGVFGILSLKRMGYVSSSVQSYLWDWLRLDMHEPYLWYDRYNINGDPLLHERFVPLYLTALYGMALLQGFSPTPPPPPYRITLLSESQYSITMPGARKLFLLDRNGNVIDSSEGDTIVLHYNSNLAPFSVIKQV
jgi:hypothetical protein